MSAALGEMSSDAQTRNNLRPQLLSGKTRHTGKPLEVNLLKKNWPELLDAHYVCEVPGPPACLQDALHMITTGKNSSGIFLDLLGNSSGTLRELFGNASGTLRELCGNASGALRELVGNSSGTPRELFGNSPGTLRELFGRSAGARRGQFGIRSAS